MDTDELVCSILKDNGLEFDPEHQIAKAPEWRWRKYGTKKLARSGVPAVRDYYKCTIADCPARKFIDGPPGVPVEEKKVILQHEHVHKATPSPLSAPDKDLDNMWMSSTTNVLQEALQAQQYVQNLTAMKMQQHMLCQGNGEAQPLMQSVTGPMQQQLLYPNMFGGPLTMPNMLNQTQMNDVIQKYGIGLGLPEVQEASEDMALILAGMKNRDTEPVAVDSVEARNVHVKTNPSPRGTSPLSQPASSSTCGGNSPLALESQADRLPNGKKRLSNGSEELPVRKRAKA